MCVQREGNALVISFIDHGRLVEMFPDPPDMVPSAMDFYDNDRVVFRGGDLDGQKATFLRDDTGAVTYLRSSRLLIKEP